MKTYIFKHLVKFGDYYHRHKKYIICGYLFDIIPEIYISNDNCNFTYHTKYIYDKNGLYNIFHIHLLDVIYRIKSYDLLYERMILLDKYEILKLITQVKYIDHELHTYVDNFIINVVKQDPKIYKRNLSCLIS